MLNEIQQSMTAMIGVSQPSFVFQKDIKIWLDAIPELKIAREVLQKNKQPVLTHCLKVLDGLLEKNYVTIMCAITHDVGKITTRTISLDGVIGFPGHQFESANIVRHRLKDLECSEDFIDSVSRIIKNHMYGIKDMNKKASIMKFISEVGEINLENWFTLRLADSLAYVAGEQTMSPSRYRDHIIAPFKKKILDHMNEHPPEYDYSDILP